MINIHLFEFGYSGELNITHYKINQLLYFQMHNGPADFLRLEKRTKPRHDGNSIWTKKRKWRRAHTEIHLVRCQLHEQNPKVLGYKTAPTSEINYGRMFKYNWCTVQGHIKKILKTSTEHRFQTCISYFYLSNYLFIHTLIKL